MPSRSSRVGLHKRSKTVFKGRPKPENVRRKPMRPSSLDGSAQGGNQIMGLKESAVLASPGQGGIVNKAWGLFDHVAEKYGFGFLLVAFCYFAIHLVWGVM